MSSQGKASPKGQQIGCCFSSNRTRDPFSKHCLNFSEFIADGVQNVTSQTISSKAKLPSNQHEAPHPCGSFGGGGGAIVVISVDEGRRRHKDDADRQPGAVKERYSGRRQHSIPQPALLGAVLAVRVGKAATGQDGPGDSPCLGKMSITSSTSKDDHMRTKTAAVSGGKEDEAKEEFEAQAAAWAESKKCKLASRYQRKEVTIQEWENCHKSKIEAKMNAEVQEEKARVKNSFTKRLLTLRHKVKGKQARVEARRNQWAVWLA